MRKTVDEVIEIIQTCPQEEVEQMLEDGALRELDMWNAMSVLTMRLQDNQKKVRKSLQAAIDNRSERIGRML